MVRYAAWVGLGLVAASCGDGAGPGLACGDGTVQVAGRCVPDEEQPIGCGPGTVDDGQGTCVPATPPTSCGDGTTLEGNTCVPVRRLASFRVEVAPVDCQVIVTGLTPVRVTVTALDGDGAVLDVFAGAAELVGQGGVTPSQGVASGFVAGVAVLEVTLTGVTTAGRLIAIEQASQTLGGTSEPFAVLDEVLRPEIVSAPDRVREGGELLLEVRLTSNACVARGTPVASLSLDFVGAAAGRLVPGLVTVTGTAPTTVSARVEGVGDEEVLGQLQVTYAEQRVTQALSVVPRLVFAGARQAWGLPASARVGWVEAQGGSGALTYEIFTAATAAGFDFSSPRLTVPDTAMPADAATITGLTNGQPTFVVVRVVDGFADGADQNTQVVTVMPGDALYVSQTALAPHTGSAAQPYADVGDALADPRFGSSVFNVFVATGTYAFLSAAEGLALPANAQLIGGFAAGAWTHDGVARSTLTFASNPVVSPAVTLASGARLDSVSVPAAVDVGSAGRLVEVSGAAGVQIRNSQLAVTDGTPLVSSGAEVTLASTSLSVSTAATSCAVVNGGILEVRGGSVGPCAAVGLDVTDGRLGVTGATLSNAGVSCVRASGSSQVTLDGAALSSCGQSGVDARAQALTVVGGTTITGATQYCLGFESTGGALSVEDSSFSSCGARAIHLTWDADSVGRADVLRSTLFGGSAGGVYVDGSLAAGVPVAARFAQNVIVADSGAGLRANLRATVGTNESVSLNVEDNTFTGTGDGVSITYHQAGAVSGALATNLVIDGNRAHDLTGTGISLVGDELLGGSQVARLRGNILTQAAVGGIRVDVAGTIAGQSLEITSNHITSGGDGIAIVGDVTGAGVVDLELSDNELRAGDGVTSDFTSGLPLGLSVAANRLTASARGFDLGVASTAAAGSCVVRVIDNTVVQASAARSALTVVAEGGLVDFTGNDLRGGALTTHLELQDGAGTVGLVDNVVVGAGSPVVDIELGVTGGTIDAEVSGNEVSSMTSSDVALALHLAGDTGALSAAVARNVVLGGDQGLATSSSGSAGAAVALTLEGNRVAGARPLALGVGHVGSVVATVRHNVLLATGTCIGVEDVGTATGGPLTITQNTCLSAEVGLSYLHDSAAPLVFSNNVFNALPGVEAFAVVGGAGGVGAVEYVTNLVEPGAGGLLGTNIEGRAEHEAAPAGVLFAVIDAPTDRLLLVGGPTPPRVGDLVNVGHEAEPRYVSGVVVADSDTFLIEVDGDDFEAGLTAAQVVLWREGAYADGTWDVRLLPGSPGDGEGAGGVDVGAYGGPGAGVLP